MMLTPGLRKFSLTLHVVCSTGWAGAVAAFVTLASVGLFGADDRQVRAAWVAMELIAWGVVVPLSIASPLTGILQSLGTPWGLFRHYWVLVKLLMTVPSTLILLLHTQPIGRLAAAAENPALLGTELARLRIQMLVDSSLALSVLVAAAALAIYKPRGLTPYGARMRSGGERRS